MNNARGDVPTLVGARCTLRELRPTDATSLQRHADDVAVWRNLFDGFPHPYTLADATAWCGGGARDPAVGLVWGIEVDAAIVGCIGLVPAQGWLRCNAEVGYWIGQAHWGRGIVADALQRVVDWAFANLGEITRIHAPIFAWNQASMAVARKCGFVQEGLLPQSGIKDGRVIDRVEYAFYRSRVGLQGAA